MINQNNQITHDSQASDLLGVPPPVFARDHQISGLKSHEASSSQISSNVLQIEMRGPNFKSLSFVDTPGLYVCKYFSGSGLEYTDISQASSSEQDTTSVADIENLVVSLISEKRTVIVYDIPFRKKASK